MISKFSDWLKFILQVLRWLFFVVKGLYSDQLLPDLSRTEQVTCGQLSYLFATLAYRIHFSIGLKILFRCHLPDNLEFPIVVVDQKWDI